MLKRNSLQYFEKTNFKSSLSALIFLRNIDIDDIEYFLYDDALTNYMRSDTEVGKYEAKITKSCYDLSVCLKVKITNEINLPDIYCQTTVVSYIGQNLVTLFQSYEEMIKMNNYKIEKNVLITKIEQGYEINVETRENGEDQHFSRVFSNTLMNGYISIGASVLLNRILISKGIPEIFSVITLSHFWELSVATYKPLESMKITLNGERFPVYGIEKSQHCTEDFEVVTHMYFTADGKLITKAQVGSPISMTVIEVPEKFESDSYLPKPNFEEVKLNWEDDMQLMSRFLDFKDENISNYIKYLRNNPDLRKLLNDFMQVLLIKKPTDTFKFASDFFIKFSVRYKSPPFR